MWMKLSHERKFEGRSEYADVLKGISETSIVLERYFRQRTSLPLFQSVKRSVRNSRFPLNRYRLDPFHTQYTYFDGPGQGFFGIVALGLPNVSIICSHWNVKKNVRYRDLDSHSILFMDQFFK